MNRYQKDIDGGEMVLKQPSKEQYGARKFIEGLSQVTVKPPHSPRSEQWRKVQLETTFNNHPRTPLLNNKHP
jgi:hypothetical protein